MLPYFFGIKINNNDAQPSSNCLHSSYAAYSIPIYTCTCKCSDLLSVLNLQIIRGVKNSGEIQYPL